MRIAHQVCRTFLEDVVARHVFSDAELTRGSGPLDETRRREIAHKQREDVRVPALARISGKGGWSPDPERRALYGVFTNVTLLDHVISVVRGGLQIAEIDLTEGRERPADEMLRRLAVVAAAAFLHDADKMLGQERRKALDADAIGGLMRRFGIGPFLQKHGAELTPDQMLVLVDGAEVTRAGRLGSVPREYLHDVAYIRLADRLDGIFLKTRPDPMKLDEEVGVAGVLRELGRFADLDTDAVRMGLDAGKNDGGWRAIELRDPHTPFLLDALQAALSAACQDRHGIPPLIETHHDGQMLVVLPRKDSEALISQALGRITGQLGARIRVASNARGKVDLLDAPGTLDDLRESVISMQAREREGVLRAGIDALRDHGPAIDAFLSPVGFLPRTPDLAAYPGRLVPIWTSTAGSNEGLTDTHRDAVLVYATLSCEDPPARLGVPDVTRREAELRKLLAAEGCLDEWPVWLDRVPADTRRALLAGYAAAAARSDDTLYDALLGPEGLTALWLEGRDGRPGLVAKIGASGLRLRIAVEAHYRALLAGQFVKGDEGAEGRCHFTNAPASRTARIDGKTGLYGVNVSAFSGREGRPESFRSSQSETLVSPIAEAEHRLRKLQYEETGRSAARRNVPVRVTAPSTAGLFGALAFGNDMDITEYALSDVLRARIEPGRLIYRNAEAALRRTRIARFEEMPTRLTSSGSEPGQVAFIAMAFAAALRTGRPVHLFRGLPHACPDFVAFDALPQPIEALLGGTGFRLEQIPGCLVLLRGIEAVADITGFGEELALRLCDPDTRFGAACDTLARAERRLANDTAAQGLPGIRTFTINLLEDLAVPTPSDNAIVQFGEAMALVQRIPIRSDGANVAELGLRTALNTVESLERMRQTSDESLISGIAGELDKVMARGSYLTRAALRDNRPLDEVVRAAAGVFVNQVWHGAFNAALPSSRDRRVALAVYRYAFGHASKRLYAKTGTEASIGTGVPEGKDQPEQD